MVYPAGTTFTYDPKPTSPALAATPMGLYIMSRTSPATRALPTHQLTVIQHLGGSAKRSTRSGIALGRDPGSVLTLTAERRKHSMMALAKKFWDDESGQGLAEYALLLGLIVIGVVVLIQGMGISIKKIFTKANTDLGTAASGLP